MHCSAVQCSAAAAVPIGCQFDANFVLIGYQLGQLGLIEMTMLAYFLRLFLLISLLPAALRRKFMSFLTRIGLRCLLGSRRLRRRRLWVQIGCDSDVSYSFFTVFCPSPAALKAA